MTKKVLAVLVTIVMVFTAVSATAASAATTSESANSEVSKGKVYEFVVEPDENGVIAIPMPLTRDDDDDLIADDTWTFKNEYTGIDRIYYCNYIQFSVRATDHNGSPVGDEIAIWLKDHYISSQLSTAYADGTWYNFNNLPVAYGDTYYFFYKNLTSTTRKIRINMMIYAL